MFVYLILYVPVSSADNLCKQFGPRSGPTKCWALPGLLKELFEKDNFEINQQTTKKHAKLPSIPVSCLFVPTNINSAISCIM